MIQHTPLSTRSISLMPPQSNDCSTLPWEPQQVKALLHFQLERLPAAHLAVIERQGGAETVIRTFLDCPLSEIQRTIVTLFVTKPGESRQYYAAQLNTHPSTFSEWLRDLTRRLASFLNAQTCLPDALANVIVFPSRHDQPLPQVVQLLDEVRASLRHNSDQLHQANEQLRRNADQLHQIDLAIMGLQRVELPALAPPTEVLTNREIEILRLVASGCTNFQIAQQLMLAQGTVSNHMTNILAKLHATNRAEASHKAQLLGFI